MYNEIYPVQEQFGMVICEIFPLLSKLLQLCTCLCIWNVGRDSDVRVAEHLQGEVPELQVSQCRMLDDFLAIHRSTCLVMRPPTTKFRAGLFEILNQFLEPCIPRMASAGCTELC